MTVHEKNFGLANKPKLQGLKINTDTSKIRLTVRLTLRKVRHQTKEFEMTAKLLIAAASTGWIVAAIITIGLIWTVIVG